MFENFHNFTMLNPPKTFVLICTNVIIICTLQWQMIAQDRQGIVGTYTETTPGAILTINVVEKEMGLPVLIRHVLVTECTI